MTIQHTTSSDSSVATLSTIQPARRPLLASIDSFESAPRPNLDIASVPAPQGPSVPQPRAVTSSNDPTPPLPTTIPTSGPSTRPPSSRPSTASSTSSAVRKRLSDISGRSTPQRNFDSPAPSPTDDVWEILGGGAMYALVGARMWLDSSDLRCVVDRASDKRGRDFPKKLEDQLNVFGEDIWCWNEGPETRTTKSRLKYVDGVRYFGYINEPPRRSIQSLVDTPVFGSEYLHISPPYTPEEVIAILEDLRTVKNGNGETWNPKVIYEPHPLYCEASQRPLLEQAAPSIDILSPNHEELLAIYDQPCTTSTFQELQEVISPVIHHLLDVVGVGQNGEGAVVVRCGRHGSCVGTKLEGIKWFPAYFTEKDGGRVIDVSGAGNSYLGGYAAGLHLSGGDPYEAALYATVSSSFMVEQIGLPRLEASSGWNGEAPQRRLEIFRDRVAGTISRIELDEVKM